MRTVVGFRRGRIISIYVLFFTLAKVLLNLAFVVQLPAQSFNVGRLGSAYVDLIQERLR